MKKYKAQRLIEIIKKAEEIEEFNIDIYFELIEKMIVFEGIRLL